MPAAHDPSVTGALFAKRSILDNAAAMLERTSDQLAAAEAVWSQQSVWSQAANRRKAAIGRSRAAALWLTIAGAVLAALATQLTPLDGGWAGAGRGLALAAAVAVGLVPLLQGQLGKRAVADWTRARSVAETLKSEVVTYLAGVAPYRGPERDRQLGERSDGVVAGAGDLLVHTTGIVPVARALPPIDGLDAYVAERLTRQIESYYRPRAARLKVRLGRVRAAGLALGATGAVLAALAGALGLGALAAWVAVVTTVSATLTAHAAAARYEYQLVEYLRTGAELERLRGRRPAAGDQAGEDDFVARCESVISIQNEGWMAKWSSADD